MMQKEEIKKEREETKTEETRRRGKTSQMMEVGD
jgi:hypothetical protein